MAPTYDIKERSYQYSLEIVKFVRSFDFEGSLQPLLNQLLRCGTSIGANIHEGSAGSSKKDFINFYNIALKSANETIYWLRLIGEICSDKAATTKLLSSEASELANIIAKIIINSKS